MTMRTARKHKNGWTPARRARQAAKIREWKPWTRSTGPKTPEGKARVGQNNFRHGFRNATMKEFLRLLSLQRRYVQYVNRMLDLDKARLRHPRRAADDPAVASHEVIRAVDIDIGVAVGGTPSVRLTTAAFGINHALGHAGRRPVDKPRPDDRRIRCYDRDIAVDHDPGTGVDINPGLAVRARRHRQKTGGDEKKTKCCEFMFHGTNLIFRNNPTIGREYSSGLEFLP